jgi:hypothetical protein
MRIATHPEAIKHLVKIGMAADISEHIKMVESANESLINENARLKAEVERLKKPAVIGGYNISEYIRMANSETLEFDNGDIFADMTLPERIKYIVESHARLKAEVERLEAWKREAETQLKLAEHWVNQSNTIVERLTKGGDRLAELSDTTIWWDKVKKGKQP